MTRFEPYEERDLADIIFDEVPYVRDAFNEYIKDKEEKNEDEELYGFYNREPKYNF